jgi:excisionase family DNA binding protein
MGEGRTGEPQTNQRLTVAQAAARLGITEGAVRSRIKRGTLTTTKVGRAVFVLLGGGTSQANQTPNDGEPTDQAGVVEELRDRVVSLERQMQRHGDETERLHQIIAGLAQANAEQARTIRAIEAPASEEPAEDAETVEEEPEGTSPRSAAGDARTATQRPQGGTLRGLRRRILGW